MKYTNVTKAHLVNIIADMKRFRDLQIHSISAPIREGEYWVYTIKLK